MIQSLASAAATAVSMATAGAALAATVPPEDIRDIRGLQSAQSAWLLPALAAFVVLLALAAFLFVRWRRRRQVLPPLPLHTQALQRLDAIRTQLPALNSKEFALAASDVVRNYIEARFGIVVTRRTSEEVLTDIFSTPDSALTAHRHALQDFLRQCDYAKFGAAAVELDGVEGIYRGARSFISETAAAWSA